MIFNEIDRETSPTKNQSQHTSPRDEDFGPIHRRWDKKRSTEIPLWKHPRKKIP